MRVIAILMLLSLGACADVWMTGPQKDTYAAYQAVVDGRIAQGRITPAEGKMVMAKLKSEMEGEAYQRMGSYPNPVAVYQPVGGGTVIRY